MDAALAAGIDVVYPGRNLVLVEDRDALLPAAQRRGAPGPSFPRDFRPVTILHAPEYRFDYLRDEIWFQRDYLPGIPHPGAGPLGR